MPIGHLMVIDPAVVSPSIDSFNRISKISHLPLTYHLPALFGFSNFLDNNLDNVRGIIIFGSATSVNKNSSWQKSLENLLLIAFENNIPILGICYGHQLIAKTFGGTVKTLWKGEIKRGSRLVTVEKSIFSGKRKSGSLLYSHQDGVTKVPPNFKIIASSEMLSIEAIESTEKPIWGFQAHLEATEAFVDEHNLRIEGANESFKFGHMLLDTFILSLK